MINVTIQTRDAESFRQSRTQVASDIARAIPAFGLVVFFSIWLSWRVFPTSDSTGRAPAARLPAAAQG